MSLKLGGFCRVLLSWGVILPYILKNLFIFIFIKANINKFKGNKGEVIKRCYLVQKLMMCLNIGDKKSKI